MKFCQPHWDALRKAIDDRGLSGFVPDGGEEAAKQMVDQIESGETTVDNFDPLMGAYWAIVGQITAVFGAGALFHKGCPLSEANKAHNAACTDPTCTKDAYFDQWIECAADDMARIAEGL